MTSQFCLKIIIKFSRFIITLFLMRTFQKKPQNILQPYIKSSRDRNNLINVPRTANKFISLCLGLTSTVSQNYFQIHYFSV